MNRLIILGVLLLGILYVVFSSIYVVNEREQAIVMRFGQITDVKTDPSTDLATYTLIESKGRGLLTWAVMTTLRWR